jgi:hypothetical protein
MEYSKIKSVIDFKKYLIDNLNYLVISTMDFNEYKDFVYKLFSKLDELRNSGMQKKDIEDFIQNHYASVISNVDDNDILFERRFSSITEELLEFCSDPFFWNSDFDLYMKKWARGFEVSWFKNI